MKKIINPDLGLFILRLALAAVFITHGWMKVADLAGTVGFFGTLGLPALLAYLVSAVELLGGIAMLLGVFPQAGGFLLALVMVGAIWTVKWSKGFVGGYELDLTLLASALAIALSGTGRYTIKLLKK